MEHFTSLHVKCHTTGAKVVARQWQLQKFLSMHIKHSYFYKAHLEKQLLLAQQWGSSSSTHGHRAWFLENVGVWWVANWNSAMWTPLALEQIASKLTQFKIKKMMLLSQCFKNLQQTGVTNWTIAQQVAETCRGKQKQPCIRMPKNGWCFSSLIKTED